MNGYPARPSTKVRATDVVHALIAGRERIVEVVLPIEKRVGAPVAATCYIDNSPPPVISEIAPGIKVVRGEGRPSKRLRRELERMRRGGVTTNDAELALLEHENLIVAVATEAATAQDALIEHGDGVALIVTGMPLRLFNQVLIESEGASAEAVARAVAVTRTRGDSFVVNLRVDTDDGFIPLMAELGLVPLSETPWMPGMAKYPIVGEAPPMPDGHEIVRLTDASEIEPHIRATALGFEMPEEWIRSLVSVALLDIPNVSIYTGYANGEPVTTGIGLRTGRTIGVYNISTVPEARRKGYAEQMTWRIAADGVRAGCDVSILQASDMGFPIYQRMGYRTVVQYMGYIDPTEPEA